MIKRFQVQNYKALRDVSLDLTPIHVLIGPNDSGKTSILEAIAALCRSVDHALSEAFIGSWEGRDLVWRDISDPLVTLAVDVENAVSFQYQLSARFFSEGRKAQIAEEGFRSSELERAPITFPSVIRYDSAIKFCFQENSEHLSGEARQAAEQVNEALSGVQYYRWDPRLLALPVAPDSKRRFRMEPSGFGLALCLDDILGYDRVRFTDIENRFKEIFPHIRSIKLIAEPAYRVPTDDPRQIPMLQEADGKGIHFEFAGSEQLVSASQVSDGVLLVLAYLAVLYLPKPPRVILVEEPENGIHPNRLRDVLSILKDLVRGQAHSQVILTTHSPYVVDLFEPEEVSLCRKEEDGSVSVRRLSESKTVREQLDVFSLGEIWTAEGDDALAQPIAVNESDG